MHRDYHSSRSVLSGSFDTNEMVNYTFYDRETHLMYMSNVASACLVVVGVVSNVFTLQVFSACVFERTSLMVYVSFVCLNHLISLVVTIMRQHTLLLDFSGVHSRSPEERFPLCMLLLWFYLEMEHCTNASLFLLVWNRIWSQRNYDRAETDVDAKRYPILLNVSMVLVAMIPTSHYITALDKDSKKYNMTMCSFSFVHAYGSPGLKMPTIYNIVGMEETALFFSLLVLVVEMVRRVVRAQAEKRKIRVSSSTVGDYKPGMSKETSETGTVATASELPRSILKARVKALAAMRQSHHILHEKNMTDDGCDHRDRDLSAMTVVYLIVYFCMATPIRIVPYFIQFQFTDFPVLTMLSLLRQAFQAGTLTFLYMGSKLVRNTVAELAAALPTLQYTSSTALFEPASGRKSLFPKPSRWTEVAKSPTTIAATDTSVASVDGLELTPSRAARLTFAPSLLSPHERKSSRLDRLELGLTKSEVAGRRQTLVLPKRGQSMHKPMQASALSSRASLFFPAAESDV